MTRVIGFILVVTALVTFSLFSCDSNPFIFGFDTDFDNELVEVAAYKKANVLGQIKNPNTFPQYYDYDGRIFFSSPSDWTSGFFPGSLWQIYRLTNDSFWKNKAAIWTHRLEGQKNNYGTHDIGFIIMSSYGHGWNITKSDHYKNVIITAAETLSRRYNDQVGAIKSWDNSPWQFPVIIDNLINLELLFKAYSLSGDINFREIAEKHLETTINHHVRENGSVYHVLDFDPLSGVRIGAAAGQGKSSQSTWARGQAWAILGFTIAYRETRNPYYFEIFEKVLAYYLQNVPDDLVPFWDFESCHGERAFKDASAAVIVAYSLLEMAESISDKDHSIELQQNSLKIFQALLDKNYISFDIKKPGIVKHNVGHMPRNLQVDVYIIYSEYYYLKSLYMLNDLKNTSRY